MAELSHKQKRFCEEYIKDSNATQAAIRAGYAPGSAHVAGDRVLKNDNAQKYLAELSKPNVEEAQMTQAEHLAELRLLRDLAKESGNIPAAIRAEELRGKCTGQYIERKADVLTNGEDAPREISVKFVGVEDGED